MVVKCQTRLPLRHNVQIKTMHFFLPFFFFFVFVLKDQPAKAHTQKAHSSIGPLQKA